MLALLAQQQQANAPPGGQAVELDQQQMAHLLALTRQRLVQVPSGAQVNETGATGDVSEVQNQRTDKTSHDEQLHNYNPRTPEKRSSEESDHEDISTKKICLDESTSRQNKDRKVDEEESTSKDQKDQMKQAQTQDETSKEIGEQSEQTEQEQKMKSSTGNNEDRKTVGSAEAMETGGDGSHSTRKDGKGNETNTDPTDRGESVFGAGGTTHQKKTGEFSRSSSERWCW